MRIGKDDIILPSEDPIGYALDWRSRIVEAIIASGRRGRLPKIIGTDPRVRDYLAIRRGRSCPAGMRNAISASVQWHASEGLMPIIEALLLSGAPYDVVASDLGGVSPRAVEAYNALFFAVRDEHGNLRTPHLLRLRFEREDADEPEGDHHVVWRRAALIGGYELLQLLWGAKAKSGARPDELVDILVEQEIARRVLAGELETRDLIRMQGNNISRERMKFDTGAHASLRSEGWNFVGEILQLLAPKRAPIDVPGEEANDALRSKLQAERNIRNQAVEEVGPPLRPSVALGGGTLLPEEIMAHAATGGRPADG